MTELVAAAVVPDPREALCLDYADTRYWRGTQPPTETFHVLDDVLAWCAGSGALDRRYIDVFAAHWRDHARQSESAFAEAVALRETIHRIFATVAAGSPPAAADIKALNAMLARAPGRDRLNRMRDGYGWRIERPRLDVAQLLAPVLWSAADLLVGPKLAKVRACANEKCRWLFLDDSKSGTRRWCSMSMCGNRAKAHRHYARQKKG